MSFNRHVSERRITAGVVAGIAFGIRQGILVDGDLTSEAAAKAAVDADVANLHVSQRTFGERVKASLDIADTYLAGYNAGGDADAIYSIDDFGAIRGLALRF
jgi:hypothetical protein